MRSNMGERAPMERRLSRLTAIGICSLCPWTLLGLGRRLIYETVFPTTEENYRSIRILNLGEA